MVVYRAQRLVYMPIPLCVGSRKSGLKVPSALICTSTVHVWIFTDRSRQVPELMRDMRTLARHQEVMGRSPTRLAKAALDVGTKYAPFMECLSSQCTKVSQQAIGSLSLLFLPSPLHYAGSEMIGV